MRHIYICIYTYTHVESRERDKGSQYNDDERASSLARIHKMIVICSSKREITQDYRRNPRSSGFYEASKLSYYIRMDEAIFSHSLIHTARSLVRKKKILLKGEILQDRLLLH